MTAVDAVQNPQPRTDPTPNGEQVQHDVADVLEDVVVEDVSIDGMCGVY